MGWALGGFGILVLFLLAAGATYIICRRYPVNWQWQCGPRDIWLACEEWRRKIAWLWAPREEKVGLVKAQHPTAQAVPGLYRQSSTNSSQYIMHSDSDLRLDAQGAFTRFECVDRDLHPPTATALTSPQHQQQSSNNNIPPQPLRPAPQPRATARPRPSPLRAPNSIDYLRLRECDTSPLTPPPPPPPLPGKLAQRSMFLFQTAESPPPPHALSRPFPDFSSAGIMRASPPAMIFPNSNANSLSDRLEEARKIRYSVQGAAPGERLFDSKDSDTSRPYDSYDIVHEATDARTNVDSMFSPQPSDGFLRRVSSNRNLQDLERITRYIQSLPDTPTPPSPTGGFYDDAEDGPASPAAPPPPAPPDTSKDGPEPTTGEKIFKALRAATSQSYLDASDFYNSILTSAQHAQSITFTSESQQQQQGHAFVPYKSDALRKTSDLFSPELNQEAHRTARQVYNSLQDPPASPLMLKELEQQQTYSYLSDPSFTRTSEDIFNSLEQHRRTSVQECLNGFQELLELDETPEETLRRRNSQELLSAMEEVTLKRRLSLPFDDLREDDSTFAELANGLTRHASLMDHHERLRSASPLDDLASLRRAISCESVCSDTSVTFSEQDESREGEVSPVVGLICVGLEHDRWPIHIQSETDLIVSVLEARDLLAPDGGPAQNTFARVCLLPDRQTHVQTRLYKCTDCPSYQEKFYFPLDGGSLGRTLLVEVFSYEMPDGTDDYVGGETTLLGEARLRLGPAPRPPATTWLPLLGPAAPALQLGELLFSLSYLPTAERLTLVMVKARNLKGAHETPGDFFVKVYLLQQGKKMHKKRTTIKRGEKSPIFNEAIIFSVPPHALPNIQLRLTVAEVAGDLSATTKAFSVGHVIVGSSTTGRSQTHWRQMLAALRRPVAMWHPLRK